MSIIKFDLGEALYGKATGNCINGWDAPQPYTPKRDADFVPPAWLSDIIVGLRRQDNIYIFGPTGCGKTAAVKFVASFFNWPVYEVTGHSRLEFPELCGGFHVADGNMVWHDGPLTAAMRNGGVLLVNEMDLLDPSTAAGLNSILDGSPLFIPELNEYIPRHAEFRFIATGNSNGMGDDTGMYQGVLRQNGALMSRLFMVEAGYLSREEELSILSAKAPDVPQAIAAKMITFAHEVRDAVAGGSAHALSVTMSPRDLIRWGQLIKAYEFMRHAGQDVVQYALDRAYTFRAPRAEREAVHELKQRVFG